jgi:hypothetical protein
MDELKYDYINKVLLVLCDNIVLLETKIKGLENNIEGIEKYLINQKRDKKNETYLAF